MPLALSQGDALRWYPVFAVLIALFIVLYLVPSRQSQCLWSAAALGLAASTDFSAALIVPPFLLYRHILQRRFRWSFDLPYWLIVAAGAAIGFSSAYYIFTYRIEAVGAEFSSGIIPSVLTNLLGFFGGDALGVSQAWIVIPIIAVFVLAAVSEIDRQKPAKPVHFLLLLLSARQGYVQRAIAVVVNTFATSAAANLISGTHPFKRNSAVPYQAIFDLIDRNANGKALVVSTDPVVPWVLRGAEDRCAGYFLEVTHCLRADRRYDSIFVISGHHDRSADQEITRNSINLLPLPRPDGGSSQACRSAATRMRH